MTMPNISTLSPSLKAEAMDSAFKFLKSYAETHEFFDGGAVLSAFRQSACPYSDYDWRNVWGGVIKAGQVKNWYRRAGKTSPTSPQSHTDALRNWRSLLFKGESTIVAFDPHPLLDKLRADVFTHKLTLIDALWAAYDIGFKDGDHDDHQA